MFSSALQLSCSLHQVTYTHDNVEVFSSSDLTTAEVPVDRRRGTDATSHLTHEQVRLVDYRSRQWYGAWEPVLAVIAHLVGIKPPRVVYTTL